jgi:ribokinase
MTIHVVGNCTIDLILTVERFPSRGETLIATGMRRELGGKGANQAVVARRCGSEVRLVAPLGQDGDGEWATAQLAAEGLDPGSLVRVAEPNDLSLIYVAPDGENTIVSTALAADAVTPDLATAALGCVEANDWLMMQGNLSFSTTRAVLAAARSAGVRTLLNPAPVRWPTVELLPLCDVAVVNRIEAQAFTGTWEPEVALERLIAAGARAAVLTLGAEGVRWRSAEGHGAHPAEPITAIDATGAGDSLCGTLCAALALGATFSRAIDAASRAAAICVARRGTHASFPTRAEARTLLGDLLP